LLYLYKNTKTDAEGAASTANAEDRAAMGVVQVACLPVLPTILLYMFPHTHILVYARVFMHAYIPAGGGSAGDGAAAVVRTGGKRLIYD
jgi:hypothetical protein